MEAVKFRVWDTDYNKFRIVRSMEQKQDGWLCEFATLEKLRPYYTEDLMQYTGLKDKNLLRIWEGDIIECTYYNHSMKNSVLIQEVIHKDGCFWVKSKDHKDVHEGILRTLTPLYEFFSPTPNVIEVIGNIHQNLEKLKKTRLWK